MRTTSEPPLLLDTHVWYWVTQGMQDAVSPACRWLIRQAGGEGRLRVSAASAWEIGLLVARGRLRLEVETAEWVRRALAGPGMVAVPLEADVALLSTRLPGAPHRDPADRFLIATALHHGWTLVTRDRRILDYAQQGHLRAIDGGARVVRERRLRPGRRARASRA